MKPNTKQMVKIVAKRTKKHDAASLMVTQYWRYDQKPELARRIRAAIKRAEKKERERCIEIVTARGTNDDGRIGPWTRSIIEELRSGK